MMAKFWTSEKFKKLKHKWEEKLKKSGFEDVEKEINGHVTLKSYSSCESRYAGIYRFAPTVVREGKEDYYRILSQKVHLELNFEDESDKLIMEWTAEGRKVKDISEELKRLLPDGKQRSKHYRNTIRYVRRRYEDKWGIKSWTEEQMGLKKNKKKPIP